MPASYESVKLQGTTLDKRRKLPIEAYAEIKAMVAAGHSQRAAARHFGVCRTLIAFILNPELYARAYARQKARGAVPSREDLTNGARAVRQRKRALKIESDPSFAAKCKGLKRPV